MDKAISTPLLTVLMPVFNAEKYIAASVESVLNQSYEDFEFLIIDDASTDQTVSIIKSYSDARIKLIEKRKNTGYTNSLNTGLKIAQGKYVGRMDSDDISLPNRFAKQISFLESNPEVIVCGTQHEIMGKNNAVSLPTKNAEIRLALLWGNCLVHSSVMIRKDALIQSSVYYDALKEPSEDYDLWVRLLPIGHLYNIPEVLVSYRIHYASVSRTRYEQQEEESIKVKLRLLGYLNVHLEPSEQQVLMKVFRKNFLLTVNEIQTFQNVKQKFCNSNNEGFFEKKVLKSTCWTWKKGC
ncbi:glycosyltransferase [Antarcticibacterium sp. 1MA-6-2]|uniref:glycosyltransferase family 2 protein n=1 Tax=Antarcticibacterium sp. 1MA-6-2 TaxID=2908210 RepID=UPI001F3F84D7|nr:glycosyltransferase [Antarcticibacterium sp. 1MA-6-2]UJH92513.1 glycosyltransferase [Antarcticibacterium sp. 1MA-6-2]